MIFISAFIYFEPKISIKNYIRIIISNNVIDSTQLGKKIIYSLDKTLTDVFCGSYNFIAFGHVQRKFTQTFTVVSTLEESN